MRATVEVETSHRLFSAPKGDNVNSGLKQWAIQVGFAVQGQKLRPVQSCFCEIRQSDKKKISFPQGGSVAISLIYLAGMVD